MTPEEAVKQAVQSIGADSDRALGLLYGFGGRPAHTPIEAARILGCPEDAVKKLGAAALKSLRRSSLLKSVCKALDASVPDVWAALTGPSRLLFKSELDADVMNRLPGEFRLAMELCHDGLHSWLEAHAWEGSKAWYWGRYSPHELEEALARLEAVPQEIKLPLPVQRVARYLGIDQDLLILAVKLSDHAAIYKGYLAPASYGVEVSLAIELHLRFAFGREEAFFKGGHLAQSHETTGFTDASATQGRVELVLSSNPHLFLSAGDMGLVGVGLPGEDISYLNCGLAGHERGSCGRESSHEPGMSHEWSGLDPHDFLREILENGPMYASDIVECFKKKLGIERPIKALGVWVHASHDIVPAAPEIYILRKHLNDEAVMESAAGLLLTARHCRLYALARFAGEPVDSYPLWEALGEERLCRWAENGVSRRLFSLLPAVADIHAWNAPRAEKDLWLFKKNCLGGHFYLLRNMRAGGTIRRPILGELFSAALCCRRLGYTNWLRIRRIISGQLLSRTSDQDGGPVLALMIALEAVSPADHWQKRHDPGPGLDSLIHLVDAHWCTRGQVCWEDEVGMQLISRLDALCAVPQKSFGWVRRDYLEAVVKSLSTRSLSGRRKKALNGLPPALAERSSRMLPDLPVDCGSSMDLDPQPYQLSLPFPPGSHAP